MAYPDEKKAMAVALLILGERVNHVARRINVPRQTVSRWRLEVDKVLDECFVGGGRYPTLGELGEKMGLNKTEID
jgi:hypothetical protein